MQYFSLTAIAVEGQIYGMKLHKDSTKALFFAGASFYSNNFLNYEIHGTFRSFDVGFRKKNVLK